MSLDTLIKILLISISLTLDAASVSISAGMKNPHPKLSQELKIACIFAAFHIFMPITGWLIGSNLKDFVSSVDHWIGFGLLGFLGMRMVIDSLKKEPSENFDLVRLNNLFLLSIAVSIDAFVVGISFGILQLPPIFSSLAIGIVAFFMSLGGFVLGKKISKLFANRIELIGGIILIGIGFKILLEH